MILNLFNESGGYLEKPLSSRLGVALRRIALQIERLAFRHREGLLSFVAPRLNGRLPQKYRVGRGCAQGVGGKALVLTCTKVESFIYSGS